MLLKARVKMKGKEYFVGIDFFFFFCGDLFCDIIPSTIFSYSFVISYSLYFHFLAILFPTPFLPNPCVKRGSPIEGGRVLKKKIFAFQIATSASPSLR